MASLEDKEALDEERRKSVSDAVDYINDHFSEAIASLDPDKLREVDAILR
jgi:enolase